MREIKFRAWNETHNRMDVVNLLDLFYADKPKTLWTAEDKHRRYDSFHLMQYTGLTDKNGVEVFEGDIVVCSYFKMSVGVNLGATEVDAELRGVIEFNDLSLCITNIVGEKWSYYTGYSDGEGSCEITYLHDVYEGSTDAEMSIEVIGNIHENPELLNQ